MIRVAVIGAGGYVGSALCAALRGRADHVVTPVTRASYAAMRTQRYDVVINAAMPSRRFWAAQHPAEDFTETVHTTADLVYGWHFEKFVQISSVSARCQRHTVYGRHKAAAEAVCGFGNALVVRLGPMYSEGLTKGVLLDMLQRRPVYISAESRYGFAPLEFVSRWVTDHLDRSGLVEVGAHNAVRLQEVADYLGAAVEFTGEVDHQEVEHPEPEYPDARDVFRFLDAMRTRPGMSPVPPPGSGEAA